MCISHCRSGQDRCPPSCLSPIEVPALESLNDPAEQGGACMDPHVLVLHRSLRCRSRLLISVWEENGCCSCKIIPDPSRLSSARGWREGPAPRALIAAG